MGQSGNGAVAISLTTSTLSFHLRVSSLAVAAPPPILGSGTPRESQVSWSDCFRGQVPASWENDKTLDIAASWSSGYLGEELAPCRISVPPSAFLWHPCLCPRRPPWSLEVGWLPLITDSAPGGQFQPPATFLLHIHWNTCLADCTSHCRVHFSLHLLFPQEKEPETSFLHQGVYCSPRETPSSILVV